MKNTYSLVFENARFICECDAEETDDGIQYFNIVITDKESGQSQESIEMPESLMAVAKAVADANLEE